MIKNQSKYHPLIEDIDELFCDLEVEDAHMLSESVKEQLNEHDSYLTLHDLEKLKPVFINDNMKQYYGFEDNTFREIDYFYYFLTFHPSTYYQLIDSVVHFKKGGHDYLKLEYKLKNARGRYEKFLGVTKSFFVEGKATYALSLLRKSTDDRHGTDEKELSKRELEIIMKLCKGATATAISEQLHISPGTVRVHVKNIYRKLGITNSKALLVMFKEFL